MSAISESVRAYVDGRIDYDELRDRLAAFAFADPWRHHPDLPTDVEARNDYCDTHVPDTDGTLLELREAVVHEGLPWDVYRRLRADLALS